MPTKYSEHQFTVLKRDFLDLNIYFWDIQKIFLGGAILCSLLLSLFSHFLRGSSPHTEDFHMLPQTLIITIVNIIISSIINVIAIIIIIDKIIIIFIYVVIVTNFITCMKLLINMILDLSHNSYSFASSSTLSPKNILPSLAKSLGWHQGASE